MFRVPISDKICVTDKEGAMSVKKNKLMEPLLIMIRLLLTV